MVLRNEKCWYKDVCTCESCTNCLRYAEMKYLMDNSGLSKNRQQPIYLDGGNDRQAFLRLADIKKDIVAFVENGESLYIFSEYTGNGKTSWAIKLLHKYFDEIWAGNGFNPRGYFIHVPVLLNKLKEFSDDTTRKQIQSYYSMQAFIMPKIEKGLKRNGKKDIIKAKAARSTSQ